MNKKSINIILLLVASLILVSFRADTDPDSNILRSLLNKLQNQYSWYPQQKAYLHTDKSSYQVDDRIWFKAYLVDAIDHRPDKMSTNLYVDLINPSGDIVQTRLLRLNSGIAWGDFSFQDTIPEGRYKLRAYTNWMRNAGEDYFFYKDIYVENPYFRTYATKPQVQQIKKAKRQTARKERRYDISFHPEGGSLLSDVTNVIGFKAINDLGQGVNFEGTLTDRRGNLIQNIESDHLGMGSFSFAPEAGEKYFIRAKFPDDKDLKFRLPESIDMGVNISLDHAGKDSIYVRLVSNLEPGSYPPNTIYYLLAHTRGKARYTAELDLRKKDTVVAIQKNTFPSGIAHFTLFNSSSSPVSERLIFVKHPKKIKINITPMTGNAGHREKLKARIKITDDENNPVNGSFSLSVANNPDEVSSKNILTELLLSSDLKGNIEDPEYYFENFDDTRAFHLDQLMLTQGWRRFAWSNVLVNKKLPVQYGLQEGIEISGKITREFFGLPLKDIRVTLTILNEFNDVYTTRSDLDGRFSFKNLSYPDTVGVKIEAVRNSGKKNLVIIVDQLDAGNMDDMNYITEQYLRKPGEEGRWVTEKTPEEIEKENDPFYEENNRYYRIHREPNDVIIVDESMHNYTSLAQIIQGRVPGVLVSGNNITIRGINSFYGSTDPLFIVDGVPVDKSFALNMNPYDIDRIEILKGPDAAIYGSRGANGVIVIFTKRGKFMLKGVLDFEMIGYYTPREYYSPRYEIEGRDEKFDDNRTTLYWKPNLVTDENGEAEVSFYTSDLDGQYSIIVEGINQSGEIGYNESFVRVE